MAISQQKRKHNQKHVQRGLWIHFVRILCNTLGSQAGPQSSNKHMLKGNLDLSLEFEKSVNTKNGLLRKHMRVAITSKAYMKLAYTLHDSKYFVHMWVSYS